MYAVCAVTRKFSGVGKRLAEAVDVLRTIINTTAIVVIRGMNNEMSRPTVLFSLTISVLHIRNFLSAVLFTHSKGKNWPPLQKNTGSLSVR